MSYVSSDLGLYHNPERQLTEQMLSSTCIESHATVLDSGRVGVVDSLHVDRFKLHLMFEYSCRPCAFGKSCHRMSLCSRSMSFSARRSLLVDTTYTTQYVVGQEHGLISLGKSQ